VSLESSDDFVQEALRSGAAGYVIKTELYKQLLPAVEAVLEGKLWFDEP
jgi:DNA-binding NarL/FixJ family response regulator